jgi:hypothetical protein
MPDQDACICNQDHQGRAKTFDTKRRADGFPEIRDPIRNTIQSVPFTREDDAVRPTLTFEAMEILLDVFNQVRRDPPPCLRSGGLVKAKFPTA